MKKLMVISAMLLTVSGFANSNAMPRTQKMMKIEKTQEHVHVMEDEIIYNFHSVKGEAHSHLLVILKGDHAFVRVDGMEYNLEKIVSASGEMFTNDDKTVVLGIKGTDSFIEINGKVANYFQVGRANKGYAKKMHEHKHEHDHDHDHDHK
ncbi:hypothetical protein CEP89_05290 [Streptobacillus moniliformis]|uniref:Uncharacterized protein n=1 Tax=Streptobacillus moniliformis (strain ATCC 14647 / DSM 12112 / NCTC 10651 / 9901) TaxID=519441 RepID=D1AVI7_STRM9|nr:hypothetical protein [Streptobacillus moniliformis]ACZ01747.1 hypothetical protein Smon_1294 [Streptobacillus moniliformis DSM 12112]AVL43262.1 hypothetical protein CEP89_05290 [Streptobacillus moniliformis]SQA13071.1 Uncharacterised protein [Streptobacillus moniliformis]